MDPKTIMVGVASLVVAAAGGKVLLTSTPTTNLTVAAGADDWTKTVAVIAQVKPEVANVPCERQREGTDKGVVLSWVCNGATMPLKEQAEIDKKASSDVAGFGLCPRLVGERVLYDPCSVRGGPLPNLDPVPEPEPVKEENPAEELKP